MPLCNLLELDSKQKKSCVQCDQSFVDVQLAIEAKSLSEVVVTGVGVATDKRKVAIDVASLNSKDVAKSAVASVEQALQGKIAGAQVQFASGTPGTGATIILRGRKFIGQCAAHDIIRWSGSS